MGRRSFVFVLALAGAGVSACSAPQTAAEKQFAEMRDSLTRVQADTDRFDQRLGQIEIAISEERAAREQPRPPAAPAKRDPTPPRVVSLGGQENGEPDDPADPNARPEIKVVGSGGGTSTMTPRAARSTSLDPEAKKTYEDALTQLNAKHYDRGLEGLTAFLVRWPDHPYTENAMYWRGEAYFAKGDYAHAATEFEAVLARFGGGNKAPDSLLKLGMCADRQGSPQRAQEYWERLRTDYPKSEAARKIPNAGSDRDRSPKGPKETR